MDLFFSLLAVHPLTTILVLHEAQFLSNGQALIFLLILIFIEVVVFDINDGDSFLCSITIINQVVAE